jgi:hypothetical protein
MMSLLLNLIAYFVGQTFQMDASNGRKCFNSFSDGLLDVLCCEAASPTHRKTGIRLPGYDFKGS